MKFFLSFAIGIILFLGCDHPRKCIFKNGYVYNFYEGSKLVSSLEYHVRFDKPNDDNIIINQCHQNGFCLNYHVSLGKDSKITGYVEVLKLKFLRKKTVSYNDQYFTIFKYLNHGFQDGIDDESFLFIEENYGILLTRSHFSKSMELENICEKDQKLINTLVKEIKADRNFYNQDSFEK